MSSFSLPVPTSSPKEVILKVTYRPVCSRPRCRTKIILFTCVDDEMLNLFWWGFKSRNFIKCLLKLAGARLYRILQNS